MRKLIFLIVGVACIWATYWFIGLAAVEGGFKTWLDQGRHSGLTSRYSALNTRGFPNRFDTTVTDIEITDPALGIAWSAPFLQVFALSYKPNHIIAVWPDEQRINTVTEDILVSSEQMRASVIFEPNTSLALERTVIELENLELNSDQGWSAGVQIGMLSARQSIGATNSYDLALNAQGLWPPNMVRTLIDPGQNLPDVAESMALQARVEFDRPWDRFAAEGQTPVLRAVGIESFQTSWGAINISAAGDLQFDSAGIPTGRIMLRADKWRDVFQIATQAGLIPSNISQTVENALEILAELSDDPQVLEVPLIFHNGRMSFGPIPLGLAPSLTRR